MTKNSVTKLALVLVGFVSGAVGGLALVQAAPPTTARAVVVAAAESPARPLSAVARINDVAVDCGVYGLPGSPAVVALTAGRDGRPVKAVIESDIFGGEDAESCILGKVAGLPMSHDTIRAVLSVHIPEELPETLATR